MNWKLHTRRNILSLLASISFLIFLDTGEDSSLLGLLVIGPKGDHHGEVWLHAAARMAPVVGDHGVGPPSVSVHIPRSHVPAARAQLLLNEAEVIDHNKILKCLCWNFEYMIELETKVAKYDAKGSFSVIVKPLINLCFKLYNQMCSWKNLRGD